MNIGQHHLSIRKRMYKNLEQFPSRNAFKRLIDYIMYVVGIAAPLALLPQIIHLYNTQDAQGLSLATWSLLGGVNFLWAIYGFLHKERQIFYANVLMFSFNLIVVIGILNFS